jgi:hypothetical protein
MYECGCFQVVSGSVVTQVVTGNPLKLRIDEWFKAIKSFHITALPSVQ